MELSSTYVDHIDSPAMDGLCRELAEMASDLERSGAWPERQLRLCGTAGVYRWFLPRDVGGLQWSDEDQIRGYLRLAEACLTTAFVITQRMGACRRIASSSNEALRQHWLPDLMAGSCFATVGLSHLTTSRRHLDSVVLKATRDGDGYVIDGYSPWVTGGAHAAGVVVGATLEDGSELLAMVPTDLPGVTTHPGTKLVALSGSATDRIDFVQARITPEMVVQEPTIHALAHGHGAGTGGLQTSTLAVGLARAAVNYLRDEASRREDLRSAADELTRSVDEVQVALLAAARGEPTLAPSELRGRANRLALNTSQAALTAAKGAGFVVGHPAGRWCREALFFLVWSCPHSVSHSHLCELAGV